MWFTLVSLHILAAMSWVGGMMFLSLILAPLVRKESAMPEFTEFFRSCARRFRIVVWVATGLLLTTGPILLSQWGMDLTNPSTWSPIVRVKLGLVALLLSLTFLHDLVLGPMVSQVGTIPTSSRTLRQHLLLETARLVPRLSLLIALAVVLAAAELARS